MATTASRPFFPVSPATQDLRPTYPQEQIAAKLMVPFGTINHYDGSSTTVYIDANPVDEAKRKVLEDERRQVVRVTGEDNICHYLDDVVSSLSPTTKPAFLGGKGSQPVPYLVSEQRARFFLPRDELLGSSVLHHLLPGLPLRVQVQVFAKINDKFYQVLNALTTTRMSSDNSATTMDVLEEDDQTFSISQHVRLATTGTERLKCLLMVSTRASSLGDEDDDSEFARHALSFTTPEFVTLTPQFADEIETTKEREAICRKRKQEQLDSEQAAILSRRYPARCRSSKKPNNSEPNREEDVLAPHQHSADSHPMGELASLSCSGAKRTKRSTDGTSPRRRLARSSHSQRPCSDDSDHSSDSEGWNSPRIHWHDSDSEGEEEEECEVEGEGGEQQKQVKRKEERDQVWLTKLQQLKDWQRENGNFKVKGKKNTQLAAWTRRQRYLWRNGKLSKERERLLNEIGFIWINAKEGGGNSSEEKKEEKKQQAPPNKVRQEAWQKKYEEFKNEWASVGEGLRSNPQLTSWVRQQRYLWRNGRLSEERERMLNEIGFEWQSDGRVKRKDRRHVECSEMVASSIDDSDVQDSDDAPHSRDDSHFGGEVECLQYQLKGTKEPRKDTEQRESGPSVPTRQEALEAYADISGMLLASAAELATSETDKYEQRKLKLRKEKAVVFEVKSKVHELLGKIQTLQNKLYREQSEERERLAQQQEAWEARKVRLEEECRQLEQRKKVLEEEVSRRERWNRLVAGRGGKNGEGQARVASLSRHLLEAAERIEGDMDNSDSDEKETNVDADADVEPARRRASSRRHQTKRAEESFGAYAKSMMSCLDEVLWMQYQLNQKIDGTGSTAATSANGKK